MFPYLRPFSGNLWLLIIVVITACGLFLVMNDIAKKTRCELFQFISFIKAFFRSAEIFLNQDGEKTPECALVKIVIMATRIVALFIVPAYTGAILSFLVSPSIKMPFSDVEEFAKDGTFKIINRQVTDYMILVSFTIFKI